MFNNKRINLKDLSASQLPEFIRAEYPTFVAFIEAYYEYMDTQDVDLGKIRDIDETLTDFIKYFKAELAHNYPIVSSNQNTERFLLKHIKDQYLAKGSEASYKLLFRLLFGKDVYMDYPGRQMLRVSDGRWTQDVSLFVRVDQGVATDLIGKTVTIQTSKKIYNLDVVKGVDAANRITANIENVLPFDASKNIYELFLDRNFYGQISPKDSVKYGSVFQGEILPCTFKVKIQNRGVGFRPGQVFQVSSGEGTPIWFKVLETFDDGGLKTIDVIKFALGYSTDFSITVLPTSAVSTKKKIGSAPISISYSLDEGTVGYVNLLSGGSGYTQVPDVIFGGNGSGATGHAVLENGQVTEVVVDTLGEGYSTCFVTIVPKAGDTGSGAEGEVILGNKYSYTYADKTSGFTEGGYINWGDYWSHEFSDGAYVGTVARQFFVDAKDTITGNPALLNVSLGAVAKYPGYYRTNDGFLDDSMFIQDSYYYQAFAYVLKIDEQLESYASVVRSMLHPSGMAMFGEYSINNKIGLSIAIDSLVKSLGVTLYDIVARLDDTYYYFDIYKDLSDSIQSSNYDSYYRFDIQKYLETSVSVTDPSTDVRMQIDKFFGLGQDALNQRVVLQDEFAQLFTKPISDTDSVVTMVNQSTDYTQAFTKKVLDTDSVVSLQEGIYPVLEVALNMTDDVINSANFGNAGYMVLNSYEEGGYFAEIYANGRATEWTS